MLQVNIFLKKACGGGYGEGYGCIDVNKHNHAHEKQFKNHAVVLTTE